LKNPVKRSYTKEKKKARTNGDPGIINPKSVIHLDGCPDIAGLDLAIRCKFKGDQIQEVLSELVSPFARLQAVLFKVPEDQGESFSPGAHHQATEERVVVPHGQSPARVILPESRQADPVASYNLKTSRKVLRSISGGGETLKTNVDPCR